ncbi:retrovirus-related pol polyprotein from transposon TNT 1-94 [Tanacetum coccineum]
MAYGIVLGSFHRLLYSKSINNSYKTQQNSIQTSSQQKPNVKYFHMFGSLCYPTNDRNDLGKMKPKADIGIFIGYSKTSRGFRIYNWRNKKIMETIHVKFDELTAMAFEHAKDSAELDGNTLLTPYDAPEFSEAKSTTALDQSNMHEFHQVQPSTHIWTKACPLEQVISNPSKLVMTRKRLQTDPEVCMYALTVSTIEPKNIKEAMSDHNWIESMQDEMHQFKRLDV